MNDEASPLPAGRGQVAVYYLLATLIAWAGWIPYGAQKAGLIHWGLSADVALATQYSPAIAAFVLVFWQGGAGGLGRFLGSYTRWRVGARWFAVALFTPPAMVLGVVLLHTFQGAPLPSFDGLQGFPDRVAQLVQRTGDSSLTAGLSGFALTGGLQAALVVVGLALANGGLSEEAGWRGYAVGALYPRWRAIFAGLWVGVLWGLWHTGPDFWAGIFQSNWKVIAIPIEYTLGAVPLSVMMTWVFINARRSLLPGILFHACYNSTFFLVTQLWSPGRPVVSLIEWLAATWVAALVIVVVGRRSLFARDPEADQVPALEPWAAAVA